MEINKAEAAVEQITDTLRDAAMMRDVCRGHKIGHMVRSEWLVAADDLDDFIIGLRDERDELRSERDALQQQVESLEERIEELHAELRRER